MARTYRRRAVLATVAFVAATALLTACQVDDPAAADPAKPDKATASPAKEAPSQDSSPAEGTPSADDGAGADEGDTGAGSDEGDTGAGQGEGVSGTWLGNVTYLAPGKYTVSDLKGTEQAFWLAEDTDIEGTGDICGDEAGQAASPCTEAELEAAAKKGVSAEVKIKDGVAVSIIDDH